MILIARPNVVANEGFPAILDCQVMGEPTPVVTWFFNSAAISPSGSTRIQQTVNNSLLFSQVVKSDEGQYLCQAMNAAGTESATIQLVVHGEPVIYLDDETII